ncbi:hypothetical protein [Mycobacterium sp.]|uniref:hypothetical protein n=1 Tax=Mycobacterium sp. TaxID=1785 RepID=UPI0039C9E621
MTGDYGMNRGVRPRCSFAAWTVNGWRTGSRRVGVDVPPPIVVEWRTGNRTGTLPSEPRGNHPPVPQI